MSFRLRVVSNFGDGDCGAGEIHTRVRAKFHARACVYFARPTIAIAKIRDYSQSRCHYFFVSMLPLTECIYHGLRNPLGCYVTTGSLAGALVYIVSCLHSYSFESYVCPFAILFCIFVFTKYYKYLYIYTILLLYGLALTLLFA